MDDDEVLTRAARPPDRVMVWGDQEHQVHDVYEPEGVPRACVVLIHGGFWRAAHDRSHLRPLAAALADTGLRVVLPEYRRTGMPGGGWPVTGLDVAAAVHQVRTHEAPAGLPVVLVGHSAGGHLALWCQHQGAGAGVAGVLALAGCLDLGMVRELGLGDGAAAALMSAIPPDRESVHAGADPVRLGPAPSPVHVLHGDADTVVPLAVSRSWWEACAVPGRDRFTVLEGAGHYTLIDPSPAVLTHLTRAVEDLTSRFAT